MVVAELLVMMAMEVIMEVLTMAMVVIPMEMVIIILLLDNNSTEVVAMVIIIVLTIPLIQMDTTTEMVVIMTAIVPTQIDTTTETVTIIRMALITLTKMELEATINSVRTVVASNALVVKTPLSVKITGLMAMILILLGDHPGSVVVARI